MSRSNGGKIVMGKSAIGMESGSVLYAFKPYETCVYRWQPLRLLLAGGLPGRLRPTLLRTELCEASHQGYRMNREVPSGTSLLTNQALRESVR